MSFSWVKPRCSEFDEGDVHRIIEAGIRLARSVPWTIDAPDGFLDALTSSGFRIEGSKVWLTPRVIDATMAAIEKRRCRLLAQDEPSRTLSRTVTRSTSGQAPWCCDPHDDHVRAATKDDLAVFSRMASAIPGLGRSHPAFIPQDVCGATRDLHTLVTLMLNSDKPYRVSVYSPEMVEYFYRAYVIYYGSEEKSLEMMTADGLHPAVVYINTPFMVSRDVLEAAWRQQELTGRPLVWSHMPVMGLATPVTVDGALALSTAEAIGANAFALATDGQVCGWLHAGLCAVDVRSLNTTQWGPEVHLAHKAKEYIGLTLFGDRPSRSAWSGTAAKRPGAQSMMERAFGFGMGFVAGARHFGGLSMLAFSDIGSAVQLMLDLELVDAMKHLAKGFSVDAETLAEEVIQRVAPGGARFMETEHTARHFREALWIPELMDRRVASVALSDVSGMLDNARSKALSLMEKAPNLCPLDRGQRNDLRELLQEADRRHGA